MSGFWSEAFDGLGDNLALVGAAATDAFNDFLNPLSPDYGKDKAPATAAEVERQLAQRGGREYSQARVDESAKDGLVKIATGAKQTVTQAGKTLGETVDGAGKVAGGALDLLTNPVVLAIGAGVVLLVVLAPYLSPVVAKALK